MTAPSVAEQMLYTTVKILTVTDGVETGAGTGFFYDVNFENGRTSTLLVSNKHVLCGAAQIIVLCHMADPADHHTPNGNHFRLTLNILPGHLIEHPDDDVDLCALAMSPVINSQADQGFPLYISTVSSAILPSDEDWAHFDAIEEVYMIGCPNGIFDETNNLPIVRRGITATSPAKRYNGRSEFLVDMACFPGSSGSPIFIYNNNGYLDRRENTYRIGHQRLLFLGVLYAGPQITNSGHIVLSKRPTFEVSTMMHLGFAIRSSQIRQIEELVRAIVLANTPD